MAPSERALLQRDLEAMIADLDNAAHQSTDPPQGPPIQVSWQVRTGQRGRPRTEIDPTFLAHALELRGPTGIAPLLDTSSRTVRRRALDHGLSAPGAPVLQTVSQPDGTVQQIHTSTTTPVSALSDNDLDAIIYSTLEVFPDFGRSMIMGSLRAQGYRIPMDRLWASYIRVHGTPGIFGDRQISRKEYKVPGPLSLAHMDGQHGKQSVVVPVSCGLIDHTYRSYPLEGCHTLYHRWLLPFHPWSSCAQQQPRSQRITTFLRRYTNSWMSQSHERRPRCREC